MTSTTPRLWLIRAKDDASLADRYATALEGAGVAMLVARADATVCEAAIFFWSHSSLLSEEAYREVHQAFRWGLRILVVRVDRTPGSRAPHLDLLLAPRLAVTVSGADPPSSADVEAVTRGVRALLGERGGELTLPDEGRALESPGELLRASAEVVPHESALHETTLARLLRFCASPEPIDVRLVVGAAGSGKTRLGIELCRQARERGIAAGFARPDQAVSEGAWRRDARTLVVVDGAEVSAGLAELLGKLAATAGPAPAGRLRLLLLARHARDWWPGLMGRGFELRDLLARNGERTIVELRGELTGAMYDNLYSNAVRAFSARLGRAAPERRETCSGARSASGPGEVQIDALAATLGVAHSSDEVIGWSLRAELEPCRERLMRRGDPPLVCAERMRELRLAVAAVTVCRGVASRPEAEALLDRLEIADATRLLDLLRMRWPGSGAGGARDRYLAPVTPRAVAEALVFAVRRDPETPASFASLP